MRSGFMVSLEFLNSSEVLATNEGALGAWLRLAAFCAQEFNGGRIVGCRGWDKARWLRLTRLTQRQIIALADASLVEWGGDDLVVCGYDHQGEEVWRRKSEGGRVGAERRTNNLRARRSTENSDSSEDSLSDTLDQIATTPAATDAAQCIAEQSRARQGEPPAPRRSHLADTLPAGLMPLSALGVPLHLDGIPAWIAAIVGLTESDVADIMRGAGPIRYVREFVALRKAWEARRAKRDETARLRAQRAQEELERQEREARLAASERQILDETRAALAAIEADPALIETADQRTHKSIGYLRSSLETKRANGISLHAVYQALPEVRAAVARAGMAAQAAAGAG